LSISAIAAISEIGTHSMMEGECFLASNSIANPLFFESTTTPPEEPYGNWLTSYSPNSFQLPRATKIEELSSRGEKGDGVLVVL
jgi:hypothetical protein